VSRLAASGRRVSGKVLAVRVAAILTAALGINYVLWRWLFSVNWSAWWIAVPLVVAETYSLIDSLLFGMTVWRVRERGEPPAPPDDATVDVFVTTYNEPIELVLATARAARGIRYPHRTWILDDGARPELRERAAVEGIGWLSRSADWADRPRHAKAGNLNNALLATSGEFILILDADQVPDPAILDRTLGYFRDPLMALVQTPQHFGNVFRSDPLGSQAPLFYGPIQQGKDGWNAAFFCGSNAVIRREALMQLGLRGYVEEVEASVRRTLSTAHRVLRQARRNLGPNLESTSRALDDVAGEVAQARAALTSGDSFGEVTYRFQRRVAEISRSLVVADVSAVQADLAAIDELAGDGASSGEWDELVLDRLAKRDWSPLGAIETVRRLVASMDVDRGDEAQPLMPLATISVTEDMATSMRLHGQGWRTAYHDEVLAVGLAPEDLRTMLTQRLRWAQGTVQVMLRENPLLRRGLSWPQRLMYFATMWSYLSGFAAVVYVAAPLLYLVGGVLPVKAFSGPFFARLVPFLVANQLLFALVGHGRQTWRGQQYSLALFPVWITAVATAAANVLLGRQLGFAVTPKTRQDTGRPAWRLIRWQLLVMAALVLATMVGLVRLAEGRAGWWSTGVNVAWVCFDLAIFSIVIRAARYRGFASTPSTIGEREAQSA
jgi:cellulose synthase (UDP-forming)